MKNITFDCPECKILQTLSLEDKKSISFDCANCGHGLTFNNLDQEEINRCSVCNCKDLHQHKDFNKKIGIAIFIVGAVFAPWTYYLSLVAALALDACLYPFFPWILVCYKC